MFELSPHINKDKIFLVNLSEIEGRLDCDYYEPKKLSIVKLLKTHHSTKKLRSVIEKIQTGYNNNQNNDKQGIKFIRTQNVRPIKLDLSSTTYTTDKKIRISNYGDLLFTRIGVNVGDVAFNDYGSFAISDNVILTTISSPILSKYISIFLSTNIGKNILNREKRDTARPIISYENIRNIQLPVFDLETQQKIIDLYETAYQTKQQKEAQAEELLNSIDDYLLNELGITLPKKDNSLKNRIFKVNFSDITGGRFDPKLYDNYTRQLKKAIENSNFKKIALKELVTHSISGDWGKDEKDNPDDNYTKCLVIRATEFDNIFNLNLDNSRVKYRYIHNLKLKKMDIQANDLLIEKSGGSPDQPVGRISILTEEIIRNNKIGFSNFIHKIRVNSEIVYPEYLFYYLKTLHNIKLTDAMQSQTNGIRNLIMNDYFNLKIAIPNIDKQKEIADHIKSKKEQAKQLKLEAKEVLEQAKLEVEKMILE